MVFLKSQQLIPIWLHLRWWLLYFLITLMMNYLSFGKTNIFALAVLMLPFIASFYSLDWIFRHVGWGMYHSVVHVIVLVLYFLLSCILIYVLAYALLPKAGMFLYNTDVPFDSGLFLSNMYRNFSPLLVGVIAYRMYRKNEHKHEKLLHSEQEKSAYLEQKLQVQHENRNLKQSLLVGQLGSHLKHNVTQMIRQRMSCDPDLLELVEGLLDIEQYNYLHMDPDSEGVLLENEVC